MAGFVFNIGAEQLQLGTTVWGTSAISARLVLSASGAPDKDALVMTGIGSTDATASVAVADCVPPAKSLARDRVEYTNTAGKIIFPSVAAIGPCDRMVFYRLNVNDAGSIPLACVEITEITPNTGNIEVDAPANGAWVYTQE